MVFTNKSLALVLTLAIVVSVFGTVTSLIRLNFLTQELSGTTGFASSDTATANLSINGTITITFVVDAIDFGAGYTNDTTPGSPVEICTIDTNGTDPGADVDCVGFNSGNAPFMVRNDGNQDVTLSIQSDKNATDFISGTGAVFQYFMAENETGACTGTLSPTTWTDVPTTQTTVCSGTGFLFQDSNDELLMHIRVGIPQDATTGSHTATITATGSNP